MCQHGGEHDPSLPNEINEPPQGIDINEKRNVWKDPGKAFIQQWVKMTNYNDDHIYHNEF